MVYQIGIRRLAMFLLNFKFEKLKKKMAFIVHATIIYDT